MAIVTIKELKAALKPGARLMGIDHGEKTWGLALSNPDLTIATPLKTLRFTKFGACVKELAALCTEYNVGGFVIGLPLHMGGQEGPRVMSVRHFADNLLQAKNIFGFEPVIAFQDERLSTFAAESRLIDDLNMPREKRRDVIDAHAAAHILQAALEEIRKN